MSTWLFFVVGILTGCVIRTISTSGAGLQAEMDLQMDEQKCDGRRCLVDQLCSFNTNQKQCVCTQGYTFAANNKGTCVDLDECGQHFHDPCGHRGVCMNTVGSYSCTCLQGWRSSDHCLPNVSYPALCMPGYTGKICQDSNCGVNGYGESVGNADDYICVCKTGWTHNSSKGVCDVDVNECDVTPGICENGATCENLKGNYSCHCLPGWHGTNCTQYNCTGRVCANQGVCRDGACACTESWIGPNCQLRPTTTTMSTTEKGSKAKDDALETKHIRLLLYITASTSGVLLLLLLVIAVCVFVKFKTYKQLATQSGSLSRNRAQRQGDVNTNQRFKHQDNQATKPK